MAITQSRMLDLIAAAKWYKEEYRIMKDLVQRTFIRDGQLSRNAVFDFIERTHKVPEPALHSDTIMREDVHFKHVGRKNELALARVKHAERQALGYETDPFPVKRRKYPQEIEQPVDRRNPTKYAPELRKNYPLSTLSKITEEEHLELQIIRDTTPEQRATNAKLQHAALVHSPTPAEQAAWAKANGHTTGDQTPIMLDEAASVIPDVRTLRVSQTTSQEDADI